MAFALHDSTTNIYYEFHINWVRLCPVCVPRQSAVFKEEPVMQAVQYERFGSPEVLKMVDVATPVPAGARLRVHGQGRGS